MPDTNDFIDLDSDILNECECDCSEDCEVCLTLVIDADDGAYMLCECLGIECGCVDISDLYC